MPERVTMGFAMVQVVADLHLHSKYSRAVSPNMLLPVMSSVGRQKGIDLLATGDWTHPLWMRELRSQLVEDGDGIFRLKSSMSNSKYPISNALTPTLLPRLSSKRAPFGPLQGVREIRKGEGNSTPRFLLSVEISCMYSQKGKGRRIHNLVFVPSFATAEKVNRELIKRGFNLSSDGRPILGMSSKHLLELVLSIDERSLLIPAHIWTPWFGIYGMRSGFMSLAESFEELAPYVYGIETGLSSDPEMNWEVEELTTRSILSFSDAHSLAKMGREATMFELESLSYEHIRQAIMRPSLRHSGLSRIPLDSEKDSGVAHAPQNDEENKVLYTIEFYPEEGKYHYSGHRNCHVTMTPDEQRETNGICPVCTRHVTDGVMRRVQELATEDPRASAQQNPTGLLWFTDPKNQHPPFVKIVPLNEIIAEAIARPVASPKVKVLFDKLTSELESEFFVLLKAPIDEIAKVAGGKVAEGIQKVRAGTIVITPGYDGVYGVVKIWPEVSDTSRERVRSDDRKEEDNKTQLGLKL